MIDLLRDTEAKDKVADKYDTVLRAKDIATIHRVVAKATLLGELLSYILSPQPFFDDDDEEKVANGNTKWRWVVFLLLKWASHLINGNSKATGTSPPSPDQPYLTQPVDTILSRSTAKGN